MIVIAGSGPSLSQTDFGIIRCDVMVINSAWAMCPDARYHYAGDLDWWDNYHAGCKSTGERWTWSADAAKRYGLKLAHRRDGSGLCREPWCVNHGANSGLQAINLAYHMGYRDVVLVGYDMSVTHGRHFHGDHKPGMVNAPPKHVWAWRKNMAFLARDCAAAGMRVVNCSEYTELKCFPTAKLAAMMA